MVAANSRKVTEKSLDAAEDGLHIGGRALHGAHVCAVDFGMVREGGLVVVVEGAKVKEAIVLILGGASERLGDGVKLLDLSGNLVLDGGGVGVAAIWYRGRLRERERSVIRSAPQQREFRETSLVCVSDWHGLHAECRAVLCDCHGLAAQCPRSGEDWHSASLVCCGTGWDWGLSPSLVLWTGTTVTIEPKKTQSAVRHCVWLGAGRGRQMCLLVHLHRRDAGHGHVRSRGRRTVGQSRVGKSPNFLRF